MLVFGVCLFVYDITSIQCYALIILFSSYIFLRRCQGPVLGLYSERTSARQQGSFGL